MAHPDWAMLYNIKCPNVTQVETHQNLCRTLKTESINCEKDMSEIENLFFIFLFYKEWNRIHGYTIFHLEN